MSELEWIPKKAEDIMKDPHWAEEVCPMSMAGYYPDGVNQSSFDRYWEYLLDDDPEDEEPEDQDEPIAP